VRYDDSERYQDYTFFAQQNHAADPNADDPIEKGVFWIGNVQDQNIRTSRKYRAMAEGSQEELKLKDRSQWEANIREAKSFLYTVTMAEHSPYSYDGAPYQPNTLVTVTDEFADVDAELLIVKVTHELDNTAGSRTTLEIMSREAFVLLQSDAAAGGTATSGTSSSAGTTTGTSKGTGKVPDSSKYAAYDNSASSFKPTT